MTLTTSAEEGSRQIDPARSARAIRPPAPPTVTSLYQQAVFRCVAAGNMTWVENSFLFDPNADQQASANALRHLVARHLLKECGDARSSASILEALTRDLGIPEDAEQRFYRLLCSYTARQLDDIEPTGVATWTATLWPASESNAISLVLWGDDYIARFEEYCARSLAADGNVPALKARGPVTLLVHTAARDVEKIRGLESLRRLGIKIRVWAIPNDLLEAAKGDFKYWLLGAIQSIHLFYAARRGANFLPIFPDVIYSARYFESLSDLARRGEDAVFLSGFRASREEIAGQLEQYAKKNAYAVPASRLIELAFKYIDPYLASCFIDPASGSLPRNRVLFAHRGDHVEIRAPHYNPALIRNSIIRDQPSRYLMTLDSEIDKVLPSASLIHFRDINDDYFATELVDDKPTPPGPVDFEAYAGFFVEHANAAHLRFEQSPYRLAIRPAWITGAPEVSAEQMASCFDRVCRLLELHLAKGERIQTPHIVWHLLKSFADMDPAEQPPQLASAMQIVRQQLMERARELYATGRLAELDNLLSPILRRDDPPAELVVLAGHCRHYQGRRKEALDLYRRAEQLDPDLQELRVHLNAFRDQAERLPVPEEEALVRGLSLPPATNPATRQYLDRVAAPHLTTLYTNDNLIVMDRALTFMHDPRFIHSIADASAATPASLDDRTWRVHMLIWTARNALNLQGDFVEVGASGTYFAAALVHYLDFGSVDRKYYLCGPFEGLDDDAVRARFPRAPNVVVIRGNQSTAVQGPAPERIAWLHAGLASPTYNVATLSQLWPRIRVGGFIILDEFGSALLPEATRAHQEFFASKGLTIAELPTGQGLVIKMREE